jgi:predicted secreted protein
MMRIYGSAVALVLACAWGEAAYSADEDASLSANLNKPFAIVVESNPTTGYSWSAEFDANRLKLKSSSYERPAEHCLGAGGKHVFVLVPLKEERTAVHLQYRRPWEKEPVKTRSYEVLVSP